MRELERTLGRIARKVARRFAEGNTEPVTVNVGRCWPTCSGRSASGRSGRRKDLPAGVSTGLAWTEAGGDVLYIEATLLQRRAPACG